MIGKKVSHYNILEKLGGGGMGVVYKAEDTKLKRTVAIKFLPPELTRDHEAKERFVREAQAASGLDHPNICTIHAVDETPDGQMFIAMAYYAGETLKHQIEQGPLPIADAVRIASDIAKGLSKAHDADMVHRDIKPANLMVTADGLVKIVDFGVAKLLGQINVTKTGTTLGTVSYMSPEQAVGGEVDGRSDVFSLGVVLYELLAGSVPFKGEREAVVLYKIIQDDPEPVLRHRPDIPEELQRIVGKALEKDVDKRYQSAAELSRDLEQLSLALAGYQTGERTAASGGRSLMSGPRRIVAAAAVVLVIAAIAWVFLGRSGVAPVEELAVAIVDFQDLGSPDDATQSAGMTGLLHVGLLESGPCRVVSPVYLQDLRRRLFGQARGAIAPDQALEVARESGATMLLTGQMATSGDDRYVIWQLVSTQDGQSIAAKRVDGQAMTDIADGVITGVLPLLAKQCEVEIPVAPPSVREMTTDSPEAYERYVTGLLAFDEGQNEDGVRALEQAVQIDSTFALALLELGVAHRTWFSELTLSREYTDQAWRHRSRLGIKDRMRLEVWRQQQDGQVSDAIETYREMQGRWPDDRNILKDFAAVLTWYWYVYDAAEVSRQGHDLYPDDTDFISNYISGLVHSGRAEAAVEVARPAVEGNPASAAAWDDLGSAYLAAGKPDSAEAAFDRALAITPDYLWSLCGRADVLYRKGDVDGAIARLDEVLRDPDLLPGRRVSILMYHAWSSVSFLYVESGRLQRALDVIEEARSHVSGPESEGNIEQARQLVLFRKGEYQEVLGWAHELASVASGPRDRYRALSWLANVWTAVDSLDKARSAVDELLATEDEFGPLARTSYFTLAEIALAEGDPEAALTALKEYSREGLLAGGFHQINYWTRMARAHRMAGSHDEAVLVLRKLLRVYGGHALGHYELGQVYEEMGRAANATTEYARFLEMWAEADDGLPQVADAEQRLASLRREIN